MVVLLDLEVPDDMSSSASLTLSKGERGSCNMLGSPKGQGFGERGPGKGLACVCIPKSEYVAR